MESMKRNTPVWIYGMQISVYMPLVATEACGMAIILYATDEQTPLFTSLPPTPARILVLYRIRYFVY